MENIQLIQFAIFGVVTYILGYKAGVSHGWISGIKSIPVTVLQMSNDLSLEVVEHDE